MILNRFFYVCSILLGFSFVVGGLYVGVANAILLKPASNDQPFPFYIEKGKGSIAIAYQAYHNGLVQKPWHFLFAVQKLGVERKLKAGEFLISAHSTLNETLAVIQKGKPYYRKISIPEGFSVAQVNELLTQNQWLNGAVPSNILEGSLFPSTYFFERGSSRADLIGRMEEKQREYVQKKWESRGADLAVDSIEELLVLASIIEKETGISSERAQVAAVFHNRLKKGMRLQSDPTVIYGITNGLPLGRAISKADLREETLFNTYRIKGLPPEPIANPGEASIVAALNPANVPYLYFVADGTGGHLFAKTLKEHNRNVAKWRKLKAKQKQ